MLDGTSARHRIQVHELMSSRVYSYSIEDGLPSSFPASSSAAQGSVVHDTMDPASAIIGIVSFGFTVFAKVNEIRKDIKGAPDKVQALQDACIGVELLLSRLSTTTARTVPCPPSAVPH